MRCLVTSIAVCIVSRDMERQTEKRALIKTNTNNTQTAKRARSKPLFISDL
ncbi:hypothetical protein VCJ_000183 [Vibrio metoecus]|nr:hypothetical protein VCJ_000183 [Vibrio metoecus]